MHGSTSPLKNGSPSCSHLQCSRTRRTAWRAPALAGSRPNARSSIRLQVVEVHSGKRVPCLSGGSDCHQFAAAVEVNVGMPASHWPSWRWRASNRAPQPSLATRARSAATCSSGTSVRSRITCQRIAGSESSSQSTTSIRFDLLLADRLDQVVVEQLFAAQRPEVQLDLLYPLQQRRQVRLMPELDADQGRPALLIGLLDVLEAHDVVGRPERIVDELA